MVQFQGTIYTWYNYKVQDIHGTVTRYKIHKGQDTHRPVVSHEVILQGLLVPGNGVLGKCPVQGFS